MEKLSVKRSLYDCLMEFGYKNERLVINTLKVLAYNGITDIDILMKKNSEELMALKGIGPKAMNLLGKVMTKEETKRNQISAVYEKYCSDVPCTCLRDWFEKCGCMYLEACIMQKILKNNGIKTVDAFMKAKNSDFEKMHGIGQKRMQEITKVKKAIAKQKTKKSDPDVILAIQ